MADFGKLWKLGCKIRLNRHKVHTGVHVTKCDNNYLQHWHKEPLDSSMHCVADSYRAILRKYNGSTLANTAIKKSAVCADLSVA